jgi:MoxR-like ATPase
MHLARAYAYINGRNYVIPDDIAALFRPAIAHRLMLKQEAKLKGVTAENVLSEILRTTSVPFKGEK